MQAALLSLTNNDVELAKKLAKEISLENNAARVVTPDITLPIAGFFENSNLQGQSISLTTANPQYPNLTQITPNLSDKISSVWCTDTQYFVQLYSRSNYSGNSIAMRAPTIALNLRNYNFNDLTKSISATFIGSAKTVTLFKDSDGTGASSIYVLGVELPNMDGSLVGNDSVSSITLSPGIGVILYRDINFLGDSRTYTNTTSAFVTINLSADNFNDATSSFKTFAA